MASIIINFNISPGTQVRVGYRLANTQLPFTYLLNYLSSSSLPYTLSNLAEGSYEIELTTITSKCNGGPCGTPQIFLAVAGDPNTVHATLVIGIDSNKNIYFSIEFSEIISSSVTVSGNYGIAGVQYPYSVVIPTGVMAYSVIIGITQSTTIDNYCYSLISPSMVNNKNISIDNTSMC